jgi:CubicO group peptidase (beta-lactamase class C family)
MRQLFFASIAWLLLASVGLAADLPVAAPADEGIGRLDRISAFFKADTDAKRIPGAVVMIARNGKVVYQEAFGVRDPATGAPMQKDSIFRMYSMTKPITGVAVLMLMEEGKIRLTDPVSKYLPALKSPKVMVETVDAQGRRVVTTVPANREITVQDLLRHTSGITYGAGSSAAEQEMTKAGLGASTPLATRMTDQQFVEELGKLPLMFQPGTSWEYGRSIDVLLALVEVVSGQRADAFMDERIFKPLGMTDTFFNVPKDKLDRVAQLGPDPDTGKIPELTDVTQQRIFLGGGEGLLSTASDYMRFALMLANGGEGNGVRLLSRKTVELMTSDHLGPALSQGPNFAPGPGYGFGLTVAVRTAPGLSGYPGKCWRVQLGRLRRHGILGRSGGEAGADHADPGTRAAPVLPVRVPGFGVPVDCGLIGTRRPDAIMASSAIAD